MSVTTSQRRRLMANTDVLAALGLVAIVVMMVIPLPPGLLDILITLNISGAVLALMLAVFTLDPLEFSVLPSLLLSMTLFRLSLNISTTRLVLLDGYAGDVIQQFGQFVIRGNPVVGFIVFVILVVVQFIVITKGAERVSEVAARFTLDAMPGKQMSIDADLNSGLINEQEARDRRKKIQQGADFYGAMDGSSKFVKGDAIAAIIILFVNIIGGFISGVAMKGMPFLEALHKYTLLTIGDGLVSQIPALLVSTATGLIVTRAASEDSNLGQDLAKQLLRTPKALYITAGVLILLALLGLPPLPMFLVAGGLITIGVITQRSSKAQVVQESAAARETAIEESKKPENIMGLLHVDHMELELGYALIALVDPQQGGDLLDRIVLIRRQIAGDMGFIVPVIRVRDNMNLSPNQYVIKIRGAEIAGGELIADHYMAMSGGLDDDSIPGTPTKEPAFGLEAKWINSGYREQAELAGYTVVDAPTVLATHLTEVIKNQSWEILNRQDVKTLVDNAKEKAPAVVEEVLESLNLGQIQKILSNLLRERVSIRDMVNILEVLADFAPSTKDIDRLTEHARQALARQIVQPLLGKDKNLYVLTLDPQIEQKILDSIQPSDYGTYLALDPSLMQELLLSLSREVEKMMLKGYNPVVVCAPLVRINLKRLSERQLPHLIVLSYNELVPGVQVQAVGMVVIARAS
ncbi:flagellar biosynthesis protein FlhA [Paradesulfitobacterium aromaticivorans]